jgi:hypothetical protein
MPAMQAVLIQSDMPSPPSWIREVADELVEDPHCRFLLFGGDETGSIIVSLWNDDVAAEVAAGLEEAAPPEATVRRLSLADTGLDGLTRGGGLRQ